MELYILDTTFTTIALLDDYESILWVDRFNTPGEFEAYLSSDNSAIPNLKIGYYLVQRDSEKMMIIESLQTETDVDNGNHLIVKGRSLESILDRRIIWDQTDFGEDSNLQTSVKKLITDAIISPAISGRRIDNFRFKNSDDEKITSLTLTAQYTMGENLLDIINKICEDNKIGYKITLNTSNQFIFQLFAGTDRSYDQTKNLCVIFSSKYDNLINSTYTEDITTYKNVTLVAGEKKEDSEERYTKEVGASAKREGLKRRELFTDANDIRKKEKEGDEEVEIPDNIYYEKLKERGKEELTKNKKTQTFEGEVDPTLTFQYGRDFFIGDIVYVVNEYDQDGDARVTEFIFSENSSDGISYYPTFEAIND